MKLDKDTHPLPEVKADLATIVVVCPRWPRGNTGAGNQFKLHAMARLSR